MERHPQLEALKLLWNFPEEVLNKVLWANTSDDNEDKELAIGLASQYLEFMDAICGVEDPKDAWEEWCEIHYIEHEINSNPY